MQNSPKLPLLDQINKFGQIVAQIMQAYTTGFVLRIFFKLCSMIGHNKQRKITTVKFPKYLFFLAKWLILAQMWSIIVQAYISEFTLRNFFKFSSMIEHNI